MRFSPVLAVLAASATLCSAQTADAQVSDRLDPNQDAKMMSGSEASSQMIALLAEQGSLINEQSNVDESHVERSMAHPMSANSEWSLEFLAQSPDELPTAPAEPPPPSQTPVEETPNQLEVAPQPTLEEQLDEDVEEIQDEPDEPDLEEPSVVPTPDTESIPDTQLTPTPEASPSTSETEPRVLVAEVVVAGVEAELQDQVYRVIGTQPGRTTTRSQLQEDINAIFATGFFSNVRAVPEDTPLGVRVTFEVTPNPVLEGVQLSDSALETVTYEGEEVPIQQAVDNIFRPQYGQILNLRDLQVGVEELNQLYQSNGYVLAQVVGAPRISPDGIVTLSVAEGVIEDIEIRFLDRDGNAVNEEGEPVRGRTRDFIVTREFESQPGDVFNQQQIQTDLQRAFGLGIFEDLNISLNPGSDPEKVDVIVNVTERNTGSFAAGIGISSASGLFGTASLQEQNLGGNNQRLNAEVQVGQRDLLFDVSFTDPWIGGDPNRTSYTVNAFGRRSLSLVFQGDDENLNLPNGDRPRVQRLGGGVVFGRPLGDGWRASVGAQYQRVSIRDIDGELTPRSEFGTFLAFDDSGQDDLFTVEFAASRDQRNDPLQPTNGSFLRFSTEQSIPIGSGSILLNRLRASYSHYIPVRFTDFTPGCRLEAPTPNDCPQALAFNVQAGTILGDLPPYEAFSLGGTDSVRGYGAGELASSRSFIQATVEYRFPLFSIVSGALFADFGSDLGTADEVPGEPAILLDKPGTGFGYGVGVRVQSPLGQIRVDYAINDDGDDRIHFGIGERF